MVYEYFVSFMQRTKVTWGISWRIIKCKEKPTILELQEALEEFNTEFEEICIITFKLLNKKEIKLGSSE